MVGLGRARPSSARQAGALPGLHCWRLKAISDNLRLVSWKPCAFGLPNWVSVSITRAWRPAHHEQNRDTPDDAKRGLGKAASGHFRP